MSRKDSLSRHSGKYWKVFSTDRDRERIKKDELVWSKPRHPASNTGNRSKGESQ